MRRIEELNKGIADANRRIASSRQSPARRISIDYTLVLAVAALFVFTGIYLLQGKMSGLTILAGSQTEPANVTIEQVTEPDNQTLNETVIAQPAIEVQTGDNNTVKPEQPGQSGQTEQPEQAMQPEQAGHAQSVQMHVPTAPLNTSRISLRSHDGSDPGYKSYSTEQTTEGTKITIIPISSSVRKIELKGVNSQQADIGFEDIDTRGTNWVRLYAVDPTSVNFTHGSILSVAEGNGLHKCAKWDFNQQKCNESCTVDEENETSCYENWTQIAQLTPGQEYTINLTPDDPAFAETSEAVDVAISPVDNTTFVVAWVDSVDQDVSFRVMNANGSAVTGTVDVDTTADIQSRVSLTPINRTAFVIAWIDGPEDDATIAVYSTSGSNIIPATDTNTNLGTNTDISAAQLGDRFALCYMDDVGDDASFRIIYNNGTQAVAETDLDTGATPEATLQNLVSCAGISSTRWAYFYFDDPTNDATFAVRNQAGASVVAAADIDGDVGETGQMAATTLDNDKFAMAFYDSTDDDITIAVRTTANGVVLAPLDIDTNAGTESRVAISAARRNASETSDILIVAWWDQASGDIKAAAYNITGGQITAPFTVETQQDTTYRLIDIIARDPITGLGTCPGTFIIAYTNNSNTGAFKAHYINGTAWDGICNPPSVKLILPPDGNTTTVNHANFTCNATDDGDLKNMTFYWNYTGTWQANGTTTLGGMSANAWFHRTNLSNRNITWNCRACDDAGNCKFAPANWSVRINVQNDITPPQVSIISPQQGQKIRQTETITINITAQDDTAVGTAIAVVTRPDGNNQSLSLQYSPPNIYYAYFTATYTGRHNITIYANDTNGNVNGTEKTWFNVTLDVSLQDNSSNNISSNITVLNEYGNGIVDVEILPINHTLLNITIFGYNTSIPGVLYLNNDTSDTDFQRRYSIDMSNISFDTAQATLTAQGNALFKCAGFNFSTQACNDEGEYTQLRTDLIIGQNYTITLTPTDPGFGEVVNGTGNISDSWYRSGAADANNGASPYIRVGRAIAGNILRGIIRFNITAPPPGTQLTNAELQLYFFRIPAGDATGNRTHGVHLVQQSPERNWTETGVTWSNYTAGANWTISGGDYNSTPTDTKNLSNANINGWISYNVTGDVSIFLNNLSKNFGWVVKDELEDANDIRRDYRSKEATQANQRPMLILNYSDIKNPNVTQISPQQGKGYGINTSVNITANVTDNINVSEVWFNITLPNTTIIRLRGYDDNSDNVYNITFNQTALTGTYSVRVIANDTSGNTNSSETTFFFVGDRNFTYLVNSTNTTRYGYLGGESNRTYFNQTNLSIQLNTSWQNGTYTSPVLDSNMEAHWQTISFAADLPNSGTCAGTASACASFPSQPSCNGQAGCAWDPAGPCGNTGTCGACGSSGACGACGSGGGCTWFLFICLGTLTCGNYATEPACSACSQCSWDPEGPCEGIPTTCDSLTNQTSCNAQSGCSWQYNQSTVKFQMRSDDDGIEWGQFLGPDRTSGTYYTTSSQQINTNVSRYLQYMAYFSTDSEYLVPSLYNVTITYSESVPPNGVSNLAETLTAGHWILWNWTNPNDPDFNHTEIWVNGTFTANASSPSRSYNVTGLLQNTEYEIETRTADSNGNVNSTWINDSARTNTLNGTISLNSFEYEQSETVQITGEEWDSGQNVTINITHNGTAVVGYPLNVTAAADCTLTHAYNIPLNASLGRYNVTAVQVLNTSKNDLGQFNVSHFSGPPPFQPLKSGQQMYIYLPPLNNPFGARPEDPFLFVTAFNQNTTLYIEDQNEDGDTDDSRGNATDKLTLNKGQSILVYIANGTNNDSNNGDYFKVIADKQVAVWAGSNSPFMSYNIPSGSGKLEGEEFYIYGRYDPDFNIPLDIIIFSYSNQTNVRLYDITGTSSRPDGTNPAGYTNVTEASQSNLIYNKVINEGEHLSFINNSLTPGGHTYYLAANNPVTVVAGSLREGTDIVNAVPENFGRDGAFYAVGKDGVAYSKLFYTYVPRGGGALGEDEMYFFSDRTSNVTVKTYWENGTYNTTYTFQLNAGNDYYYPLVGTNSSPYKTITASQPISVLCGAWLNQGTGDMGDFATSLEGSGVGKHFNIYIPEPGGTNYSHAILFAFYNNTYYEIFNSTNNALLDNGTLDAEMHYDFMLGTDAHLVINTTKPVSIEITNYDDNIGLYAVASPIGKISVVKSSEDEEVQVGSNVTFNIGVYNPVSVTLYNLTITDTIYDYVDYLESMENPEIDGPYVYNNTPSSGRTTLKWFRDILYGGEYLNITLKARSMIPNETIMVNEVDVNGTDIEGALANGEDSAVVFLIDTIPPNITNHIDFPDPQEINRIVTISATITDNIFVLSATVQINGTNYSMERGSGDEWHYNYNGTSVGMYNYTIFSIDAKSNNATPVNGTFQILPGAQVPPYVTLLSPSQAYYDETNTTVNVTFQCNATENSGLVNISLYITNASNQSFARNQTRAITGLSNSSEWNLTLATGNYTWNCQAYDNNGNNASSEFNRTIRIEPVRNPGTITNLSSPYQGYNWIYWNWTNPADYDFDHVEVWVNGTFYANTSANEYNVTGLTSNKYYQIQIRTADLVGNINTTWVNDTNRTLFYNTLPPSEVNMTFPNSGNDTLINRTPTFYWNESTDPESQPLQYELNITSELCTDIYVQNITGTNYTLMTELGTYDECGTYNWTIRAFDGAFFGNWPAPWNFSIQPYVALTLANGGAIDFGDVDTGQTNDTSDGNPPPFLLQSDSNVIMSILNVTSNQSMFTSLSAKPTDFQIKAANSTEIGAFNWTESATDWINLTSIIKIVDRLNWRDVNDSVAIDVKIHVPDDEPPGEKVTGLVFYAEQT
jgi:hypothetical protein